ncbi:MAG TPA: hypothetical protein VGD45_14090 [Steroidobacter sp.]|uniref:hypothetical protein n=1 Tax=Steroidobacter sp. TaxID=1978227 RepID=UPI002EDB7FD4
MKQPLYRKENTTAHLARHDGGDYRDERRRSQRSDASRGSMHGGGIELNLLDSGFKDGLDIKAHYVYEADER